MENSAKRHNGRQRPASVYTNGIKRKLLREQEMNLDAHASEYELDQVIPLPLGGHPPDIHNLTLQPWDGADGAKMRDKLEVRLSALMCAGRPFESQSPYGLAAGSVHNSSTLCITDSAAL